MFSTTTSDLEVSSRNRSLLLVQVDRHVVLVARLGEPRQGGVLPELPPRREGAGRVARPRQLHLDHLRAELPEEGGGDGTQEEGAELDDPQVGEGLGLAEDLLQVEQRPGEVEEIVFRGRAFGDGVHRTPSSFRLDSSDGPIPRYFVKM
jgi:hypothetical protein